MGNLGGWCSRRGISDFLQALLEIKQGRNLDISIKTLVNILPTVYEGKGKRRPGSREESYVWSMLSLQARKHRRTG